MASQNLIDGVAGGQLAQDVIDRDAGALDHWVAEHHIGIDADAIMLHGLSSSSENAVP
jgi:hypothetical protein